MTFQPEYQKIVSCERETLPKFSEIVTFKVTDSLEKGIGNVLAKSCQMGITNQEVMEKQVNFDGEIICTIAFTDLEGEMRSMTYKGKVSGTVKSDDITPTSGVVLNCSILDSSVEHIAGSDINLAIAYQVDGAVLNQTALDVLVDGKGFSNEKETCDITSKAYSKKHSFTDVEEESVKNDVSLVLSAYGTICADKITVGDNIAMVEGSIKAYVTYLTSGEMSEVITDTFTFPYHEEMHMDGATIGMVGDATANCSEVKVTAYSDDVKRNSKFTIESCCSINACCYLEEKMEYVEDVFSSENELMSTVDSLNTFKYMGRNRYPLEERMSFDLGSEYDKVECVMSCTVEVLGATCEDGKIVVEGLLKASLLMAGEMGYELKDLDMPVVYDMNYDCNENCEVSACMTPIDVSAKLRLANEVEIVAKVNTVVDIFEKDTVSVICELEKGEEKSKDYSAIVIYVGCEGDSLMDVAKKVNVMPSTIQSQNKDVAFPLKNKEKIVIYRQKTI